MKFSSIRKLGFVFFLPLLLLRAVPEATRIEFYYGIAQGNYLIGDFEGAAKGVKQMLKLDPDYTPALALNARILIDMGAPLLALDSVEKALLLDPENPGNMLLKALVLGNLDRCEEAIAVVEGVIQSVPAKSKDHRVASKLLGLFLMAEGNSEKAAQVFNKSYLNNPEVAKGNLALAVDAYQQTINQELAQNNFEEALVATNQALELLQNQTGNTAIQQCMNLKIFRAQIFVQIGRDDEAIKELRALLRQKPDDTKVLITLASLYASTGRWDALKDILPDISVNPELQDINFYLKGRIAIHHGRIGSARESFESGLQIVSDHSSQLNASMKFYLGACLIELGKIEAGDNNILKALENGFRPETEEEVILASHTFLRNDQAQLAIVLLEAVTLNQLSNSPEVWNLLGRAHQAEGSTVLALSTYNQSLGIQPDQPEVLALRGSLLRKLGDFKGAVADLKRALTLSPETLALEYSLGLIYLQMGELITALEWLSRNSAKLLENPGVQLLKAHLAYCTGDTRSASMALKSYFELVPKKVNESAFYLEHILIGQADQTLAFDKLNERIGVFDTSNLMGNFLGYIQGKLDRKTLLDAAGCAESPVIAQRQICEMAYWLAQHEFIQSNDKDAKELLELAVRIGLSDYPEYQFAQWQLNLMK